MSVVKQPVLQQVAAEAPAGIGNLGVGFDVLGQALEAPCDRVSLRARATPGITIEKISGVVADLPRDPARNAATAGLVRLMADHGADFGIEVEINKGIAIGSGMGGSAASSVAGVVAGAALMGLDLPGDAVLAYALDGEAAATGERHADNVASAIYGGVTVAIAGDNRWHVRQVPVAAPVFSVLVHPHVVLETREARRVLPEQFGKATVIRQSALLAGFMAACAAGDLELLAISLRDVLVEPHRAPLIKGFAAVKRAALDAGALGCSISGGGPSVFAWCRNRDSAVSVGAAMAAAFAQVGVTSDTWISPVNSAGARIIK